MHLRKLQHVLQITDKNNQDLMMDEMQPELPLDLKESV